MSIVQRRRVKHIASFEDRLAYEANRLRERAKQLQPGLRRDELLRKAGQAKNVLHGGEKPHFFTFSPSSTGW